MGKQKVTRYIVLFIGCLSILVSVLQIMNGETLSENYFGIFIGVTLVGVFMMEFADTKKETNEK